MPNDKNELKILFDSNKLRWFHQEICSECHKVPLADLWLQDLSLKMHIHSSVKRQRLFHHWEPIFIGTNDDPFYDERLNWEGKSDKMTQAYIMCLLDYNFNVLSNGFLIHKSGFKSIEEAVRIELEETNRKIIFERIMPEIDFLYGINESCVMYPG